MKTVKRIKGHVVVDERQCTGCGYCEVFCPERCMVIDRERLSPQGNYLPVLKVPEACKACGICAIMCPSFAVEVYRLKGNE